MMTKTAQDIRRVWVALCALWRRDWQLLFCSPAQALYGPQLFILICLMLALGLPPDPALLLETGNIVIWIAVLLASTAGGSTQIRQDFLDGGIHTLLSSPCPTSLLALIKIFAHWFFICGPAIILAPLIGWTYGFDNYTNICLVICLILATPTVSALALLAGIFSTGVRGGDLLAMAIALPFCLPIAVVGADAVSQAMGQGDIQAHLLFLTGLLLLAIVLSPWAIATAWRVSYN